MNWRELYTKIKVGDRVKCIVNPNHRFRVKGAGWRDGFEFRVTKIDTGSQWAGEDLLWHGHNNNGVFSDNVEKVLQ